MTLAMLADRFEVGKVKTKSIVKELAAANVIRYDYKTKAYYMSRKFIKKGMAANENQV
jgi:DNA-binding IclR family transcriptional regulator